MRIYRVNKKVFVMQNKEKIYQVVPLSLKLRIFITRLILLWENMAKTIFYMLFLLII